MKRRTLRSLKPALTFLLVLFTSACALYHAASVVPARPLNVVFVGDSIQLMFGHRVYSPPQACDAVKVAANALPPRMFLATYFPNTYVNEGIGRQTSAHMLANFDTQVLAHHPDVLFIEGGTADVFYDGFSPEQTESNIEALVAQARANHIRVVLATLAPAGAAWTPTIQPFAQATNRLRRQFAQRAEIPLIDYEALLEDANGLTMPEYNFCDDLHLSPAAYDMLAPRVQEAINEAAQ